VILGEPDREALVRRNDAIICEILGGAFESEEFSDSDELKPLTIPLKMENDAVFKFERIRRIVKLSLEYTTWDQRILRFGVEVPPMATVVEIVAKVQKRAEPLKEARYYAMHQNLKVAFAP
jgi:hypothetical protein